MSSAAASSSAPPPRPAALVRRDSSSSDEDGLREVLPEELEDLEVGGADIPVPLEIPGEQLAANQLNPRFNGNWEPDQSTLVKRIGLYVPHRANKTFARYCFSHERSPIPLFCKFTSYFEFLFA